MTPPRVRGRNRALLATEVFADEGLFQLPGAAAPFLNPLSFLSELHILGNFRPV
jgi:hypothetical protein